MAEDKNKMKDEQLQDEQLDDVAGGQNNAPKFEQNAPPGTFL